MQMFLDDPVFTIGDQAWAWADVVRAAILRGDWDALENDVREELFCVAHAAATGEALDGPAVDEAARAFRYDRDLITAAETTRWLEQWGLTPGSWMAWVRRCVARDHYAARLTTFGALYHVEQSDIDQVVLVDAVCNGRLASFARSLAARAAAAAALSTASGGSLDEPAGDANAGAIDRAASALRRRSIPGLDPDAGRIVMLLAVEDAHTRFCDAARSSAEVRAIVASHRLDWIRLTCRVACFDEEPAALEAALCVRDDGETLDRVAGLAHASVREVSFHLDELEGTLRHRMFSARPGELLGPVPANGGFSLYEVVGKEVPAESDAAVRARATDVAVRRAVAMEVERRVRWQSQSYATA